MSKRTSAFEYQWWHLSRHQRILLETNLLDLFLHLTHINRHVLCGPIVGALGLFSAQILMSGKCFWISDNGGCYFAQSQGLKNGATSRNSPSCHLKYADYNVRLSEQFIWILHGGSIPWQYLMHWKMPHCMRCIWMSPMVGPAMCLLQIGVIPTGRMTWHQQLHCTLMTRKFRCHSGCPPSDPIVGKLVSVSSHGQHHCSSCHCCVNCFGCLLFLISILMLAIILAY